MEKALALAYRYLAFRPRSIKEVILYLERKAKKYAFTPDEIHSTIELLKDQGFLNDAEFIKSYVAARNSLKPKSKRVLVLELKKYGVPSTDIERYFEHAVIDEDALAVQALKRKMKTLRTIPNEQTRLAKAVSFLQRRGFSYDIAKHAYNDLYNEK